MLLLFATPLFVGFANVIMPLQIGSPDVAFPRLNMFSYWLFLFGGAHRAVAASSPRTARPTSAGSPTRRCPTRSARPGVGGDLWIMGLALAGLGTILGAVNFITTIICMRAPGMTMFRMPIFTWNILVTVVLVLIAFPVLAARAARAGGRPQVRGARLRRRQRRRRSCGSTCSGSSAIPRSTSSRCRSSASSPRSCRSSAASRSSATSAWSARRIAHRGPVGGGVGAPHVRHRRGAAAVLLVHDVPDRGTDRGEVLQLDRHDVGRVAVASTRRCCGRSASWSRSCSAA